MMILTCLTSCKEKSVEMGPVETLEAFCRAMTAGEWAEAEALCNAYDMKEYIDTYRKAFDELQAGEHNVTTIVRSVLANTEITVLDNKKDDKKRCVTYLLKIGEYNKTRKAILGKEDGKWRVEKIADLQ